MTTHAPEHPNALPARVGPGTPTGELMRQYWLPAAKSGELVADGDPMRLLLLGEKLIAFRDSDGRIGVMDHRCPHRNASLFLGRNEERGIRCVYHGWKFDADGRCVDMPSAPPSQDFKDKVRARAYKAAERNGLVWVYMGDAANVPPLPQLEATLAPEAAGHARPDDFQEEHPMRHTVVNRAPEYKVADTDWGTSYGAHRIDPRREVHR